MTAMMAIPWSRRWLLDNLGNLKTAGFRKFIAQ
jgi:hypothetical protein